MSLSGKLAGGGDANTRFIELAQLAFALSVTMVVLVSRFQLFQRFEFSIGFDQQLAQSIHVCSAAFELSLGCLPLNSEQRLISDGVAKPIDVDQSSRGIRSIPQLG